MPKHLSPIHQGLILYLLPFQYSFGLVCLSSGLYRLYIILGDDLGFLTLRYNLSLLGAFSCPITSLGRPPTLRK